MSYREAGARVGGTAVEVTVRQLARAIERLAAKVQRIEASNRTVPPDTVLEREMVGDELVVFVRRISTDQRWQVSPPVVSKADLDAAVAEVKAYVDTSIANIDFPEPEGP